MVAHTSIVYSVDAHVSGLIVSSSEDCFAKIWKDGVCLQSIEHPGCVWDAKFLVKGDIVTACSDGVVRVWTVHHDRIAIDECVDDYLENRSCYISSILANKRYVKYYERILTNSNGQAPPRRRCMLRGFRLHNPSKLRLQALYKVI